MNRRRPQRAHILSLPNGRPRELFMGWTRTVAPAVKLTQLKENSCFWVAKFDIGLALHLGWRPFLK